METNIETKICRKCGRELPRSEFYAKSTSKDGLQSYCKECIREDNRKSYHKRMASEPTADESTITRHSGRLFPVYTNPKLAEFKDRELMLELKARGFRWEYMLEPQRKIMYDKLK